MKDRPTVSVITLTFNHFEKLFMTIGSVLLQDYPSIELIICDDGSDCFPKTELVRFIEANNYHDFSYKIIASTNNVGTVKNANRAYKASTGQYIFNLSSGDFFASERTVSQILSRLKASGSDFLVATRLRYSGEFKSTCLLPHVQDRRNIESLNTPLKRYKALVCGRFFDMASGSAIYFKRSIIERFGYYDERFTLWEDGPFLEKYFWNGDLIYAYDIIAIWYQDGGISSTKLEEKHPALKADSVLFFQEDAYKHIEVFNHFEKRQIQYQREKNQANNALQRLIARIKHPIVTLSYYIYFAQRNRCTSSDLELLKLQSQQHKKWISRVQNLSND